MRVIHGLKTRPKGSGCVLTLGVFDGVHRGHAKVLAELTRQARRLHLPAMVLTFDDHPHGTLLPHARPLRLATPEQCLRRFQDLGANAVTLLRFTPRLAQTVAEDFVRRVLVKRLWVKHVVVGHDFVFGRAGRGDLGLLQRLGEELGFTVSEVAAARAGGQVISSSRIRQLVAAGRVEQAGRWLGWPYALHGRVVQGDHRGRTLGFPTANLATHHELIPAAGTYGVQVELNGRTWPGLGHIGRRPTFYAHGPRTIEVFIPGWRGSLYGRRLAVAFSFRLRAERKFKDAPALVAQMQRDWEQARERWGSAKIKSKPVR